MAVSSWSVYTRQELGEEDLRVTSIRISNNNLTLWFICQRLTLISALIQFLVSDKPIGVDRLSVAVGHACKQDTGSCVWSGIKNTLKPYMSDSPGCQIECWALSGRISEWAEWMGHFTLHWITEMSLGLLNSESLIFRKLRPDVWKGRNGKNQRGSINHFKPFLWIPESALIFERLVKILRPLLRQGRFFHGGELLERVHPTRVGRGRPEGYQH